jgi:hypothetical protein
MQLIDADTERAMRERAERAERAQRERDARRAAYDYYVDQSPTRQVLDMMRTRAPISLTQYSMELPRATRVHRDTAPTLGTKGTPAPNEWERNAPRPSPGVHKHECPNMRLVKCHHRW